MSKEESYKAALEKITALEHVSQIRGGLLADMSGSPDNEGWVAVPPQFKAGLVFAARIAADAIVQD